MRIILKRNARTVDHIVHIRKLVQDNGTFIHVGCFKGRVEHHVGHQVSGEKLRQGASQNVHQHSLVDERGQNLLQLFFHHNAAYESVGSLHQN